MKTIDDLIRELNGTWPPNQSSHICLACSDNTGKAHVFTREQFDRRAAELGYWVEWEATETSECPVDGDAVVEFKMGSNAVYKARRAAGLAWHYDKDCPNATITRYRVVQTAKAEQLELMWGGDWVDAKLIGSYDGEEVYGINAHLDEGGTVAMAVLRSQSSGVRTRPSDRERWVGVARKELTDKQWPVSDEALGDLYDAGLAKMPGDV